jgi:mannose-6-phosphate isomerase-like protein (cupin superfamily)
MVVAYASCPRDRSPVLTGHGTYDPAVTPEARLEGTEAGLVAASPGWFVMNARDARWFESPGRGHSLPLTGSDEYEAETFFPMLGMAIRVMTPGEPSGTYHWETEQEDFLVLAGEGLLIVEGQERPLKQWDFVHCPPETVHAFVGAGDGPCVLLCASSRRFQKGGPWGMYCADKTAARHNASSPQDTGDGSVAYARFAAPRTIPYHDGLLAAPGALTFTA